MFWRKCVCQFCSAVAGPYEIILWWFFFVCPNVVGGREFISLVMNSLRINEKDSQSAVSKQFKVETMERRASTLGGVMEFNLSPAVSFYERFHICESFSLLLFILWFCIVYCVDTNSRSYRFIYIYTHVYMLRLFICIRLMVPQEVLGSSSAIHFYVNDTFVRLYRNIIARMFLCFYIKCFY